MTPVAIGAGGGARAIPGAWLAKDDGASTDDPAARLEKRGLKIACVDDACAHRAQCRHDRAVAVYVLGAVCTRRCAFCGVETNERPRPLDPFEPARLARAIKDAGLAHVILKTVARDDLDDGGAHHLALAIRAIRASSPTTTVEVHVPDFTSDDALVAVVMSAEPHVLAHAIPCVPRLDPLLRDPRSAFARSIAVLDAAHRVGAETIIKSGLMVGLGERDDELCELFPLLRDVGVTALTIGQYLPPTPDAAVAARVLEPLAYRTLRARAVCDGIPAVRAGPFVRATSDAPALYAEARAAHGEGARPT